MIFVSLLDTFLAFIQQEQKHNAIFIFGFRKAMLKGKIPPVETPPVPI